MSNWFKEFEDKQIIEWRKKYLRYTQLEDQIKIIENTTGENLLASQNSSERGVIEENSPIDSIVSHFETVKILQITVVSAENLPTMDVFGSCDAYCLVEFCGKNRSTSVKKNTLTPTWNEVFAFNVTKKSTELNLKLLDWEMILGSDLVGTHTVSSEQIAELCTSNSARAKAFTGKIVDAEGIIVVGDNGEETEIKFTLQLLSSDLRLSRTHRAAPAGEHRDILLVADGIGHRRGDHPGLHRHRP